MSSRTFLLLQGVASPFFYKLANELVNAENKNLRYQSSVSMNTVNHVVRISFCGGDWLISRDFSLHKRKKTINLNFRQPLEKLPEFIRSVYQRYEITDIVLFGDLRPVHQAAIEQARASQINIHVFEEGYLRPCWITLEKNGVNANSDLPKDPQWFIQKAKSSKLNPPLKTCGKQLPARTWHDMRYHFTSFLLKPFFPHYRTHRPETPLVEYKGWIKRFSWLFLYHKKHNAQIINEIVNGKTAYYLLPLQLNADTQMSVHSPIKTVVEVIRHTLHSFAHYAPENSLLVIKNHPLDTGLINYSVAIKQYLNELGISDQRVIYLETGDLDALLSRAKGTILINSTVGLTALGAACPTIALGKAIYDLPGLTYQDTLDKFWQDALLLSHKPDPILFKAFRDSLISLNQINGDFYTKEGIIRAVSGSIIKLFPDKDLPVENMPEADSVLTEKTYLV